MKYKDFKMLSIDDMKQIMGGNAPAGACYIVYSDQGYSSCWYTNSEPDELCNRVYGSHCNAVSNGPVDCESNNCTMN